MLKREQNLLRVYPHHFASHTIARASPRGSDCGWDLGTTLTLTYDSVFTIDTQ